MSPHIPCMRDHCQIPWDFSFSLQLSRNFRFSQNFVSLMRNFLRKRKFRETKFCEISQKLTHFRMLFALSWKLKNAFSFQPYKGPLCIGENLFKANTFFGCILSFRNVYIFETCVFWYPLTPSFEEKNIFILKLKWSENIVGEAKRSKKIEAKQSEKIGSLFSLEHAKTKRNGSRFA
jgi:hypothetical protein